MFFFSHQPVLIPSRKTKGVKNVIFWAICPDITNGHCSQCNTKLWMVWSYLQGLELQAVLWGSLKLTLTMVAAEIDEQIESRKAEIESDNQKKNSIKPVNSHMAHIKCASTCVSTVIRSHSHAPYANIHLHHRDGQIQHVLHKEKKISSYITFAE